MKAGIALPKARIQSCSTSASTSQKSRQQPRRCLSYSSLKDPTQASKLLATPSRREMHRSSLLSLRSDATSMRSVSTNFEFTRLYSRANPGTTTTPGSAPEQAFFYSHQSITQAEDDEMLAGIKGSVPTRSSLKSTPQEVFLQKMDEISLLRVLLSKTNPKHQSVNRAFVDNMLKLKEAQSTRAKLNSGITKSFQSMNFASTNFGKKGKPSSTTKTTKIPTVIPEDFTLSQDKVMKFAQSSREITAKDVATFLKIHAQSDNPEHAGSVVLAYLEELIMQSNENTLPAIAQFITDYLWEGPAFVDFLPKDLIQQEEIAQNQISLVLARALEVFPSTTISTESGEVEETPGVVLLTHIEKLLDQFSSNKETDSLKDLFLRLVSQSGTYARAATIINKYTESGQSFTEDTIDMFVQSLSRYSHAKWEVSSCYLKEFNASLKADLYLYQPFFISENVTPAITNFLLDFVVDPDEFYGILEVVEGSRHSDRILSVCQPQILKAAVRCHMHTITSIDPAETNAVAFVNYTSKRAGTHTVAMSHMFGLLNRFNSSSAGVTSEALEQCLVLSARLGNTSGMHQALALRLHLTQGDNANSPAAPLPNSVLSKVFDAFPISKGAVAQEKANSFSPWIVNDAVIIDAARDESILFHLRSQLDSLKDTKEYSQYLSALGRCQRSDLIIHEWQKLAPLMTSTSDNSVFDNSGFQDVILSLLAAFKTADSTHHGCEIIEALLEASNVSAIKHRYALNVLTKVFNHELLPLAPTLNIVSKWFLHNTQAPNWSNADIVLLYGELSPNSNQFPELINTASNSLISQVKSELAAEDQDASASHLVLGRILSDLIIQVRNGQDIQLATSHVENLFGKYS